MSAPTLAERFAAVDRVLRAARGEVTRGCHANAALFLRAASADIHKLMTTLDDVAEVIPLSRREGRP